MALSGRFILKTPVKSTTEFQDLEVTYPSDLREDDEHYDKRGTTVIEQIPLMSLTTVEIEHVYINIRAIEVYRTSNITNYYYNITFREYNSEEDRRNDIDSYNLESNYLGIELDHTKPLIVQAYEYLNSQDGWEELITV